MSSYGRVSTPFAIKGAIGALGLRRGVFAYLQVHMTNLSWKKGGCSLSGFVLHSRQTLLGMLTGVSLPMNV